MKKFFISAVMALFALAASAQQQEAGKFSIMPRAGLGYTNISNMNFYVDKYNGSSYVTEKQTYGDYFNYQIGVEGKYQISDVFGISLGVDYKYNKASKSESAKDLTLDSDLYNFDFSFGTIAVPVLAQFNIGNHFGVKCGIQPAFLVSAKTGSENIKPDCKGVVWTVPVGISWTFNNPLVLDLRYDIPISSINKGELLYGCPLDGNLKMSTISLTLGYRFDL